MLRINTNESIFEYFGDNNFIVVPISKFVTAEGTAAVFGDLYKLLAKKYPELPTQWGFYLNEGVGLPIFRLPEGGGIIGLPVKEHYAGSFNPEVAQTSLWLLDEFLGGNVEALAYLTEEYGELNNERAILLKGAQIEKV